MNSPLDANGVGALNRGAAWQALEAHHAKLGATHLRELFASDATRGKRLVLDAAGLYLDYSKNRITDERACARRQGWCRLSSPRC